MALGGEGVGSAVVVAGLVVLADSVVAVGLVVTAVADGEGLSATEEVVGGAAAGVGSSLPRSA